ALSASGRFMTTAATWPSIATSTAMSRRLLFDGCQGFRELGGVALVMSRHPSEKGLLLFRQDAALFRRHAHDERARSHLLAFAHDRAGRDHRASADARPGKHDRAHGDRDAVADRRAVNDRAMA